MITRNDNRKRYAKRRETSVTDGCMRSLGITAQATLSLQQRSRGAWRIDERGQVTGEYVANPNFASATRTES